MKGKNDMNLKNKMWYRNKAEEVGKMVALCTFATVVMGWLVTISGR